MISQKQNLHTKYTLTSDSLTEQQQRYQQSQANHLQDREKLMKLQDEKKTLLNEVSYLSGTGASSSSLSSSASSSFPPITIDHKPAVAPSVKSMNTNNESIPSSAFPSTKTELSSSVVGGGNKAAGGGDDAFSTFSMNEPSSSILSSSSPRKEDPVSYSPLPSSSSVASSSMKKEDFSSEIDPFGDAFSSAAAAAGNNDNISGKNEADPFGDPFDDSAFGTEQSASSMKSLSSTTVSSSVVSPFSAESGKPSTSPPKPVKPSAGIASSEDPFGGFDDSVPAATSDPFGDPFGDAGADNGGVSGGGYSSPKKEEAGSSMKSGSSSSVLSDDPFSDFDDNVPVMAVKSQILPPSTSSPLPPMSSSMKSTGSSSTVSGAAPVVPLNGDPFGDFDDDKPTGGLPRKESDPFAAGIAASLGENDPFGAAVASSFPSSTTPKNDDPFDSFGGADVGGGADPFGGFDASVTSGNTKDSSFGGDDDAFGSSAFAVADDPFVSSNKKAVNDDPFDTFDE
jgi:hypothetical protein